MHLRLQVRGYTRSRSKATFFRPGTEYAPISGLGSGAAAMVAVAATVAARTERRGCEKYPLKKSMA